MGFDLMVNFNRPYLSATVSEFWSRWHISLSTWFKDYLYIPLGGNRAGKWKWYRNLLIVFMVSGLWHGANWTFIVWGALHGFYTIFGILTQQGRNKLLKATRINRWPRLNKLLNQLSVFALVTFAWIFFRAEDFQKAKAIISNLCSFKFNYNLVQLSAGKGPFALLLSFASIGLLAISYRLPANMKLKNSLLFLVTTTILIIVFGKNGGADFIYFQF